MKLLILTTDYPRPDGTHERMFVHVRDLYYAAQGIAVTVLNFACEYDYEIDGIRVITQKTYQEEREAYDIAVSHASNLRNHYRFLKKYEAEFSHIVFFFHGHEVLKLNEAYPAPYSYLKTGGAARKWIQGAYDVLKLRLWRKYYQKLAYKSDYVFVSNWIFHQFQKNTGLQERDLLGNCHIIHNSIGGVFETVRYEKTTPKEYDFVTIRSNLDGSKYGVDLVMKLAEEHPDATFLLIGRGNYFAHHQVPENVTWISKTLHHSEMIAYLNRSKCGILLTREDTQGVMTCELAAFGMPVITSDIEVCHEFFAVMPNVAMIANQDVHAPILEISEKLSANVPYPEDRTYFAENTISKEIALFERVMKAH